MPEKPKRTKLERLSAGALLLAQEKTEKGLNEAVARAVAQAAASAQTTRRTALLLGVVSASKALGQAARGAIVDGRQGARVQSARRLRVEAGELGVNLPDGIEHRRHLSHDEDDVYGQSAGDSLGAAWSGLALAMVYAALRKEQSVPKALKRTQLLMRPRVERVAATESARAYSDEWEAIANDVRDEHPKMLEGLGELWSAILDTRVCPTCAGLDGEVIPIGGEFDGGYIPGQVHVLCRCVPILVNLADYKALAA